MQISHFRERLNDIAEAHATGDGNLDYAQWTTLYNAFIHLFCEASGEARCAHKYPLYDKKLCLICGRIPNERNTLSKDSA